MFKNKITKTRDILTANCWHNNFPPPHVNHKMFPLQMSFFLNFDETQSKSTSAICMSELTKKKRVLNHVIKTLLTLLLWFLPKRRSYLWKRVIWIRSRGRTSKCTSSLNTRMLTEGLPRGDKTCVQNFGRETSLKKMLQSHEACVIRKQSAHVDRADERLHWTPFCFLVCIPVQSTSR